MPTHVPTEPPRLEQEPGDTTFLCRRQLKFEVSGTVLWWSSRSTETISLKEATCKSILVKYLENEEKNIHKIIREDLDFNLDIDDHTDLSKLSWDWRKANNGVITDEQETLDSDFCYINSPDIFFVDLESF